MFALKIIVVASAILNVGFSATQCSPDEVVEFVCQEPTCSYVEGGSAVGGRLRTGPKQPVSIIGYNEDSFLIKNNKNLFSIVGKNNVHLKDFANLSYWTFKIKVHNKTFKVCDSTNQNPESNHYDSSFAQTNSNTDTPEGKTSDANSPSKVINDASINSQNNEQVDSNSSNKADDNGLYNGSDEDVDDDAIAKIESEDESNFDTSSDENRNAKNLADESFSANSDQNTISELSNTNNLNEKTSQINSPKPTSPQQLENDSSTECTLDSCVNDPNTSQQEPLKNVAEESNDHIQSTKSLPIVQNINDSNIEFTNNMTQNSNSISLQDNNNTISVQDTNATEELNLKSSLQQNSDNLQTTQHLLSSQNMDTSINESNNNLMSQNSNVTVDLQENNNVTEESSMKFSQQLSSEEKMDNKIPVESIDRKIPQSSITKNVENNDDETKGFADGSNQRQNVDIPSNLDLLKLGENSVAKESVSEVDDLKDIHLDAEKINETQFHGNSGVDLTLDTSDTVNQQGDINDIRSLEEEKSETKNKNGIDNVLSSKNPSKIEKQPEIINFVNNPEGNLPESQNTYLTNLPDVESTSSLSNDSIDNNMTSDLENTTQTVSSTDFPKGNEVEAEVSNKKTVDQCTPENGCLKPPGLESTPNYDHRNVEHQFDLENKVPYENIHKTLESKNNEKSKEFEPKSLVSSFGHPDACSGINCLKFKINVDKSVKSPQPVLKQEGQDPTDINFEEEKENIIDVETDQTDAELNFLSHFQNLLSSPTLNSLDFLWNIFGKDSTEYQDVYTDQSDGNQNIFENFKCKNHSELYFVVAAVITLLFSIIYYKFQKGTYENHLLTLLAAKDQNLLILEKELSILKEQSSGSTKTTIERHFEVETLSEHLTKSEDIISSQAIRIEKLEQEVEELTESGMEMHTLLSSALESSAKSSEKFNTLKVKLVDSENLVAALTQKNFDKTKELEKKNGVIKTLQSTVDELTCKNNSLIDDNANVSLQLEQILTKNSLKESRLQSEISKLQFELDKQTNALLTAENEVSLSKDALQEVLSQKCNPTESKKFLSSIKLSAELKSAKQMCDEYKHKLDESSKSIQKYLDHIDDLKNSIVSLGNKVLKLEEEKEGSVNKLNILTKFFKDQEKEYLKQINEKALLFDTKEGESSDLIDRIKFLNQEISNYKSEIQSLKKEITDQEASFKIQISAADKKASDNWILFRQAERKFKEMELETAQLRNKMTMGDKKLENGAKSIDSSKDFEDELLDIPLPTVSPDFTLLSLLDFEPPPPILTNQRLPPLGALGQAPSPPVPLSRRHDRSLSPGSPPPQRSSAFRPLPQRYNYMNRQNSLGHSVESLDK